MNDSTFSAIKFSVSMEFIVARCAFRVRGSIAQGATRLLVQQYYVGHRITIGCPDTLRFCTVAPLGAFTGASGASEVLRLVDVGERVASSKPKLVATMNGLGTLIARNVT